MTRVGKTRRPTSSAIPRALHVAAAGVVLALTATVVLAQGWEPRVSVGPSAPKTTTRPQAKALVPKVKPATVPFAVVEAAIESGLMPEALKAAASKAAAPKAPPVPTTSLETGSIKAERAEEYCANIANPAADARFAWQKKMLTDMEQEIAKRIQLLEEKTAEYQKWLARRDEFSRKANETVLRIYARMRPDAAAVQLAALDEETAASVLTKLEPRTASLILNEMEAAQAVRLTATISGAGKVAPVPAPPSPEAKTK